MFAQPYASQDDLVRDRLVAASLRVAARAAVERGDASDCSTVDALEDRIEARCAATRDLGREWPIEWIRPRLALSPTEERVLWLLLAHEIDRGTRAQLRGLATETSLDVTMDVLRRVVYGDGPSLRAWQELSPEAPIFRLALVDRSDGQSAVPDQRQTLRVSRRILALAHGRCGLDPEVSELASFPAAGPELADVVMAEGILDQLSAAMRQDGMVIAAGPIGVGRRTAIRAVARAAGCALIEIDARALASDREKLGRQLRVIRRECMLHDRIPLVRNLEALATDGDRDGRLALLEHVLASNGSMVLATATGQPPALRGTGRVVVVRVPGASHDRKARMWARAVPGATRADAERLASMFPLAPAVIHATGSATTFSVGDRPWTREDIAHGIRTVLDSRIGDLAARVTVRQTWDDLVLPADQLAAVVELLARVRERGRVHDQWGFADKLGKGLGTTALFSGPPGTGKTMVAGLAARDLGLELFQADLSKITSKWLGETEKNLAALFDAAEAGQAVLLFDEADSLFAKRTEVKSSNDRYANLEVNFLLQRLESFTGVCILTTNHEQAMDDAFRRRLSLHVRFPMPEEQERARLWQAMIPATAPTAPELDFGSLGARFVMSGGHIRNAVLRAAFLAADQNQAISMTHLARGARLEYEAMGKLA